MIRGRLYMSIQYLRPLLPFKMDSEEIAQLAYLSDTKNMKPRLSALKLIGLGIILYINYLLMGVFYYRTARLPDDFMDSFRTRFENTVKDESIDAPGALQKLFFKSRFFEPVGNMVLLINVSAARYFIFLAFLSRLLRFWLPNLRDDAASYLTSGSEGILSTDMGRRIWLLAKQARLSPTVVETIQNNDPRDALHLLKNDSRAVEFMQQLNKFLFIHGHRALKEIELNSVRWEEDPTPIVAMIRNYIQSDVDPTLTEQKVVKQRTIFEREIRDMLQTKFLESSFGIRWRLINALRNKTKYDIRLRENSRFFHIMGFYAVRKKVLALEADLLAQGALKCEADIFYLEWSEIQELQNGHLEWADVEDRIRERRMEFIRLSKMSPPKTFGIKTRDDLTQEAADKIQGQGASPGEFEGVARVIMDPGIDATVVPGEILVAPYTDPAWTPLFLTASAAVVEVGSYLSHAGTIAREYGLPCVVDAANCTERVKTGDRIRVNGSTGVVSLLNNVDEVTVGEVTNA
jgi:phosphohistidine swiveling domain-containing protein